MHEQWRWFRFMWISSVRIVGTVAHGGVVLLLHFLGRSRHHEHLAVVGGVDVALDQLVHFLLAVEQVGVVLEEALAQIIEDGDGDGIQLGAEYRDGYAFFYMHWVNSFDSQQQAVGSRMPAVPVRLQFSQVSCQSRHTTNPMYAYIITLAYHPGLLSSILHSTGETFYQKIFNFTFTIYPKYSPQYQVILSLLLTKIYAPMHRHLNEEDERSSPNPGPTSHETTPPFQLPPTHQPHQPDYFFPKTATQRGDHSPSLTQQRHQELPLKHAFQDQDEAINAFVDSFAEKQKNSRQGQQNLFKRTDSLYEDQLINEASNTCQQAQPQLRQGTEIEEMGAGGKKRERKPQTEQEESKNKFVRPLESAQKYLKILQYSNYLHLFRFAFIMFIYYNMSFKTFEPSTRTIGSSSSKNPDENKETAYFLPWNAMIYFLSGSVDFISVIGYISSIRLLKSDIKILQARCQAEDEFLKRKQVHRLRQNQQILNTEPEPELQMNQIQSQEDQRSVRIGKQSAYSSVYTTLRQYKHKNRDQAAPFKISKIMHIFATFFFFGRMALIEMYDFQQLVVVVNGSSVAGEISLWFFLFLAYFAAFQIDYFVMETSLGPYIKIDRFYLRRIRLSYEQFWSWRGRSSILSKIGVIFGLGFVVASTALHLLSQVYVPSVIFFTYLACLITNCVVLSRNNKIVAESRSFIQACTESTEQGCMVSGNVEPSLNKLDGYSSLQNMLCYKNLSLLGILAKHSQKYDNYLAMINRIALFVFLMALLRESNTIYSKPLWYAAYSISFGLFFAAEFRKFHYLMGSKINLLDSCKYKEISRRAQKQKTKHGIVEGRIQNPPEQNRSNTEVEETKSGPIREQHNTSSHSRLSECSICLLEYSGEEMVIAVCCGHIFHQECLIDWLKHKKQCPLCRLNISQFYEEVSF